jgi:phosphatidylglycerophosphate synthase
VAVGLTLAEAAALGAEATLGGRAGRVAARRAAPGVALALAYTHFDTYVHLGLNNAAADEPLLPDIGLPTTLTLARRAIADYLWGRLLGGQAATPTLALGAMLAAAATDIADGAVARSTGRTSRLGAYMDAEADLSFWLALALTLAAHRRMPRWLVALLIVRFVGPFAFALASYFGWVKRLPIASTTTGKVAGVAQAVAFGAALLPTPARKRIAPALPVGYAIVGALLVAAPLAQLLKVWREG